MKALTQEGQRLIDDIAAKYNVTPKSVEILLRAVIKGSGTMAQFNIPELGGAGQWMKGGMTMVGDMFNNSLRTTVDKLCSELAGLVTSKVVFESKDGDEDSEVSHVGNMWSNERAPWPAAFGHPTSSGSQNSFRYAYFGPVRRLVVEENGKRTIYDTKHHEITGISQQQGLGNSYRFTGQDGPVDLGMLTVLSEPGTQSQATPAIAYDVTSTTDVRSQMDASPQDIIIATIEKINVLFERGQITEQEFKAKKAELLGRL